ncbi:undecaprenyl-diphosphatase [Aneurinibacillus soli]|uniref:Undecaprenyl-diphosphatase n=1 Tax=Aneurinibacillus soli TaxID=1500254 RepID=A0A0U5BJU9_9BACL|nr:undecaprenyl-diphosphate phosphatase [Aneurinibacillus soli]PYE61664.1 undecaprenyl-diphosphatase [Aneurinibacillus soli]BAU28478.1 Undecaprenyl-diphosphatase [Aneurinibacillus soli]
MILDIIQTLIFAIIQGITELFPISSVAHGVLTPFVFHWKLDPEFLKEHFLPYVVMLHLGTAVALFIFFWHDWMQIIRSLFSGSKRTLLLIIVATLPAAIIGLVLEKPLKHMFSSVTSAAIFLILNGFFLYFGEKMRSRGDKEIDDLTVGQALIVGLFQSLALIPGFSRSGSSMTAGFWMGLKHEASARFSMLLATPIIAGASILEIPKLIKGGTHGLLQMSLIGGVMSGIFAFISVWILMRWFKENEITAMRPFAYYCWLVGALILLSMWL